MNSSYISTSNKDDDQPSFISEFDDSFKQASAPLLPSTIKTKKKTLKKKRQNLQGIRGLAILSVLGFHFLPNLFPNGYLGVDQFFVLSGFLMCMLLQRSYKSSQSIDSKWFISSIRITFQFYYKRFKRILPLYLLVIFISLQTLFYFFPDTAYETNIASGKTALFFVSNRVSSQEEDYFSMLAIAVDIFTHTWSLSVEIQFYLLIPFLFLLGAKTLSTRCQWFLYGFCGCISYLFSVCFQSESEAFNSVLARIWQFVIGMLVYNFTIQFRRDNEYVEGSSNFLSRNHIATSKLNHISKYFLTISMIAMLTYPYELAYQLMRPIITFLTGIIMAITDNNVILSLPILTYIGDISYSLYLIHWPIYAYWKLVMSNGDSWNIQLLLCFLSACLLSILSYEIFEKWYLKLSNVPTIFLCSSLFLLNLAAVNRDEIENWLENRQPRNFTRLDGLGGNRTYSFDEADYLNRRWSKDDIKNLIHPSCQYESGNGPFGWCRHKGLNDKYKFMVIGNSWAANHARIIYEECGYKAKSILQGSAIGCDPLYSYSYGGGRCEENMRLFERRVAEERPDYIFLLSRFIDISDSVNVTNINDDPIYQSMKKQTERLMKYVSYKLFILTSIPEIEHENVKKIVPTLKNGGDLVKFDKTFVHSSPESARLRHEQLIKDCDRCIPIDYKPLFWNTTTNTWRYYDVENSGLSYMTQIDHLNYHGLELVRKVYTNICKKL